MPNSLLSIPVTVQLQPPTSSERDTGVKHTEAQLIFQMPFIPYLFFSVCFSPLIDTQGNEGKTQKKNKTSLIKYLIPQEATQNSERLSLGPRGTQ